MTADVLNDCNRLLVGDVVSTYKYSIIGVMFLVVPEFTRRPLFAGDHFTTETTQSNLGYRIGVFQ